VIGLNQQTIGTSVSEEYLFKTSKDKININMLDSSERGTIASRATNFTVTYTITMSGNIIPSFTKTSSGARFDENTSVFTNTDATESQPSKVVELRRLTSEQAVPIISSYVENHSGCRTSDIIYGLNLDPRFTIEVLKRMEEKKLIRSEKIE